MKLAVNGQVYFGARGEVEMYGLVKQKFAASRSEEVVARTSG